MSTQITGTRLKVNGHDMGNITGSFSFSRQAVAERIGSDGIAYVAGASEVQINTDGDGMVLAPVPRDVMARLQFANQMISYLQSSQSQHGPNPFKPEFVPSRIRLHRSLRGDFPIGHLTFAPAGEHDCQSNQWGAISVLAQDGKWLGVKPDEREILAFVRNPHL